ncbi:MAG: LCP family protein, partial [Micrococcales bacterium]
LLVGALIGIINRGWLIVIVTLPPVTYALAAFLMVFAIVFALLALDTLRLMRLNYLVKRDRTVAFVGLVLAAILGTSTISWAGNTAGVSAGFIGSIFNQSGFTSPENGRYNILLLGGDSGKDRFGLRPDSIGVMSIDAATGKAVNISIPRNMQHVSFVDGSPMLKVYPHGWNCGLNCLVNAIYKDTMDNHQNLYPDAVKHGSDPGVEATRDAVEWVTGLKIQSYVMIDMAAFSSLIDSLGGITINVKTALPIGGQKDDASDAYGWIQPGLQKLDGYHALWYARSRHGAGNSDYMRMARQREVENAVLAQMDPMTVLTHFQSIAKAGQKLVRTDIPSGMLGTYVNLASSMKKHGIAALPLTPPAVNEVNPDFAAIRVLVQKALAKASGN